MSEFDISDLRVGDIVKVSTWGEGNEAFRKIKIQTLEAEGKNDCDIITGKLVESTLENDRVNEGVWSYVEQVEEIVKRGKRN